MDTRQSEHSRGKSQTQIKMRNPFELLIKIIRLPNVCNKCGHITRMKEISDILEQFDTMTSQQIDTINEKLIQKSNQILAARQQLVKDTKNELQQSLQQLIQVRQSMGSSFNFEDKEKCLERVCEVIINNTIFRTYYAMSKEQIEIQNSLSELNSIIQEQYQKFHQFPNEITEMNKLEYHDNLEIRERLEGALRINQSHKDILKEILIKIGEENKSYTFDIQLQFRQQQLEMLNLLQCNQEQIKEIERIEDELNDKKLELQKYAILFSQFENPFKSNKVSSEESSASNFQSIQKDIIQPPSSIQQSRNVFQDIKNIQSKRFSQPSINENNNMCTFQSEQFYSIDQSHGNLNQESSQKSSQNNSKQIENSVVINQRYGNSISNKFNNSKATSLISQINSQQNNIPIQIVANSTKKIRNSIDTNPMMSQESFDNENENENDENSPKITPTSKTFTFIKVPHPKPYRARQLGAVIENFILLIIFMENSYDRSHQQISLILKFQLSIQLIKNLFFYYVQLEGQVLNQRQNIFHKLRQHEVFIKKFNQKDNPSDSKVLSEQKHLYDSDQDDIVVMKHLYENNHDNIFYMLMEMYNSQGRQIYLYSNGKATDNQFKMNKLKQIINMFLISEQIMYFLKQIIKGYRHLMNFGIFHRYLDPKNIYYVGNNKDIIYKIGGFGHSKFLDDQDSLGEECTKQQNWGYYQAPEQQEIKYSYKSDLFSLGLILHEMATKQQLKSKKELETKKLDLCDLNIDDFLKNLLLQMIVFKPQQRLSWSQLIIRMFYKSIKLEHQNEITISLERKQNCFIKIIKKPIKNYEICLEERAKSEMEINRVLQRNENKNIVKIYDLLHEPDSSEIYIIMEKCEGSLADLLEKKKFNIKEILDLVSQINDGYEFLQQEKIMHRDIKPENILYKTVEKQIEYKIADFGISCKAEQAYSKCGTTPYKAPEVKGDFQYYNKCDIYSLGILICYVAQKKYPFDPNKLSSFFVLLRDKKTIEHCYPSDTNDSL
ncbi:unnamed protein product (macronuclear) [Paramecium tetraurelia]|uniref:Protein kinase domain-containing protein n=1 Tax=Paramecium tetraurelia TaxID=5888 RepID=A0BYN5_PARTE|nr:uncharacterized protein GSPATT00033505001 [Paramecium tetraurelia]CAK63652.1 unnamed protein product [Paramecium tetraurelia]|eukprot:XP_001431050.1 hypothetical protein (macronuclear) [Paramecium tetraurelia strain d4-2]